MNEESQEDSKDDETDVYREIEKRETKGENGFI